MKSQETREARDVGEGGEEVFLLAQAGTSLGCGFLQLAVVVVGSVASSKAASVRPQRALVLLLA